MSTEQTPSHSGFTAASTAADVIAGIGLSGTTGGASGLGVETVRAGGSGRHGVVPARDTAPPKRWPASAASRSVRLTCSTRARDPGGDVAITPSTGRTSASRNWSAAPSNTAPSCRASPP